MLIVFVVMAGVLGLAIGSFLNVVIYRVPAGESLSSPPSHCPACDARIRWIDNIPVVSWLVLRGRCRHCKARISIRYPIVEAATCVAFVLVALCFAPGGWLAGSVEITVTSDLIAQILVLVAYLWFAAAGIALAAIDLDARRLPDPIVWTTLVALALLFAGAAAIRGDLAPIGTALLGGLAMLAFYFLLVLIAPRGMGLGDVKLSAVLGVATGWIGWSSVLVGWFAGFLIGALVGVGLIVARRAGRRAAIPFGPWMLVGAWVGIVAGPWAWQLYTGALGLA